MYSNGQNNKAVHEHTSYAPQLMLLCCGQSTIQSDVILRVYKKVSCMQCALWTSVTCLHAGVY